MVKTNTGIKMQLKRIKAYLGLKIVRIGIWLYDNNLDMHWDNEDKSNIEKLWKLHDQFEAELK